MIKIHIAFDTIVQYRKLSFMKLHHASNHGIELAEWCKDQGLIMNLDFTWAVSKDEERLTFTFLDKGEKYSSMFALKFGSGEREH